MQKLLLAILLVITSLVAEVVGVYHPPKEPAGLYLVDIEMGDSYSIQKRYRIYCPSAQVRDISGRKWDKARDILVEDRLKRANGTIIDAYNQTCNKNISHPGRTLSLSPKNDIDKYLDEASANKQFLIALSTKNHQEAKKFAKKLSHETGIPLNLRGLHYNKKLGLSLSRKACSNDESEYPCYIARGRYDDGVYISVEYSSSYQNFRDGYYIVVVASGNDADSILRGIRSKVRDAYIKSSKVYMGCMH